LKKVQLGKLESILTYQLVLAALPAPATVFPAGTSRTCLQAGITMGKIAQLEGNSFA
jgi:hypothetical protein